MLMCVGPSSMYFVAYYTVFMTTTFGGTGLITNYMGAVNSYTLLSLMPIISLALMVILKKQVFR